MDKQEDFKHHLVTLLQDIRDEGAQDGEAMFLLGSLASDLIDDLKFASWPVAKNNMDDELAITLLKTFDEQGNLHMKQDRRKQAYAIQIMATSLVAKGMRADEEIASCEGLLDDVINRTVQMYREQRAANAN
jgi:hypothetical protein